MTVWQRLGLVVLALFLLAGSFWGGLWIRDAMFDFVYGDAARELIREMVKPEALK